MANTGLTIKINTDGLDEAKQKVDALIQALTEVRRLWVEISEILDQKIELIGSELFLRSGARADAGKVLLHDPINASEVLSAAARDTGEQGYSERMETAARMCNGGRMTTNEARILFGLPPLPCPEADRLYEVID